MSESPEAWQDKSTQEVPMPADMAASADIAESEEHQHSQVENIVLKPEVTETIEAAGKEIDAAGEEERKIVMQENAFAEKIEAIKEEDVN